MRIQQCANIHINTLAHCWNRNRQIYFQPSQCPSVSPPISKSYADRTVNRPSSFIQCIISPSTFAGASMVEESFNRIEDDNRELTHYHFQPRPSSHKSLTFIWASWSVSIFIQPDLKVDPPATYLPKKTVCLPILTCQRRPLCSSSDPQHRPLQMTDERTLGLKTGGSSRERPYLARTILIQIVSSSLSNLHASLLNNDLFMASERFSLTPLLSLGWQSTSQLIRFKARFSSIEPQTHRRAHLSSSLCTLAGNFWTCIW